MLQECEEDKYSRDEAQKGINFEAFKALNLTYLKKMKLQTCWLILEHYGYDEKLRIDEKHLVSIKVKEEEIEEKWEGVELSDSAIEYLIKLFGIYASQDATIDQEGIDQIFQTAVDG